MIGRWLAEVFVVDVVVCSRRTSHHLLSLLKAAVGVVDSRHINVVNAMRVCDVVDAWTAGKKLITHKDHGDYGSMWVA